MSVSLRLAVAAAATLLSACAAGCGPQAACRLTPAVASTPDVAALLASRESADLIAFAEPLRVQLHCHY